jgi:hypothetical protein
MKTISNKIRSEYPSASCTNIVEVFRPNNVPLTNLKKGWTEEVLNLDNETLSLLNEEGATMINVCIYLNDCNNYVWADFKISEFDSLID